MEIFNSGLNTCRYPSLVEIDQERILVPLNSTLLIWNIFTKKIEKRQKCGESTIGAIQKFNKGIFAHSYNGDFYLLSLDLVLISELHSKYNYLRSIAVHPLGFYFATCSEMDPEGTCLILQSKENNLNISKEICGVYRFVFYRDENTLISISKDVSSYKYSTIIVSLKENIQEEKGFEFPENGKILDVHQCGSKGVLTFQKKTLCLFDISKVQLLHIFKFEGNGNLSPPFINEEFLYCMGFPNTLFKIDLEKYDYNSKTTIISDNLANKFISSRKSQLFPFTYIAMFISNSEKRIIYVNESSINLLKSENNFLLQDSDITFDSISRHSIGLCGIDLSEEMSYLITGDLSGGLYAYSFDSIYKNEDPEAKIKLPSGVRSVCHLKNSNIALAGTMGGILVKWEYKKLHDENLLKTKGTITCIKQSSKGNICASTSKGILYILDSNYKLITSLIAHTPSTGPQNEDFGSLKFYAEIWSCCWSPSGEYLVSTSEDQTCSFWKFLNNQLTLQYSVKDNVRAVTCVDWKIFEESGKEFIATCSDDQTINLYDPRNQYNKINSLNSYPLVDWHTLTYLGISDNGKFIAASSQNGYLLIWSTESKKILYMKKLHNGGIEGLVWKTNYIGMVSSDCTITLIKIKL